MIPQKDKDKLVEAIGKFLNLSYEEKKQMGLNARKKVEQQFDRQLVVEAYMREVNKG
jgi:galacturonosyltransferase